jgi:hypothetical protein
MTGQQEEEQQQEEEEGVADMKEEGESGVSGDGGSSGGGVVGAEVGCLVPVLDMFNHDPDAAHVEWVVGNNNDDREAEGSSSSSSSSPSPSPQPPASLADLQLKHPRAVVRRPVRAGEQILISYTGGGGGGGSSGGGGSGGCEHLLLAYGFASWHSGSGESVPLGWGLTDLKPPPLPPPSLASPTPPLGGAAPSQQQQQQKQQQQQQQQQQTPFSLSLETKTLDTFVRALLSSPGEEKALVEKLVAGAKLEYSVSHTDPAPASLLRLARAVVAAVSVSTDESANDDKKRSPQDIEKEAWRYLAWFFSTKLQKLSSHLDQAVAPLLLLEGQEGADTAAAAAAVSTAATTANAGKESGDPITSPWDVAVAKARARSISAESQLPPLSSTSLAEDAGFSLPGSSAATGAGGRGGSGTSAASSDSPEAPPSRYATTPSDCVLALVDAQVSVLQHAWQHANDRSKAEARVRFT